MFNSRRRCAGIAALIAFTVAETVVAQSPLLIGIVEQLSEPGISGNMTSTNLRLAFSKSEFGWSSICESKPNNSGNDGCTFSETNKATDWHVYSKGRRIGTVTAEGWVNSKYSSKTGLLRITSQPIPKVGAKTDAFSGWTGNAKTARPLLALRGAKPTSPQHWEQSSPRSRSVGALVASQFQQVIRTIEPCREDRHGNIVGKSRAVSAKELEIFMTLLSNRKEKLFGVRLKRVHFAGCDGPPDFSRSDVWFYEAPGSPPQMLPLPYRSGSAAVSLTPVDFADFDGDGSSDVVFWLSAYNEDGYVLNYDRFKKHVAFTWGYH